MLETLLGSTLRAKVLKWLFTHPGESFYVRQITSLIGGDSTNLSRELATLEKTGIILVTRKGNRKYYSANINSPIFEPIKSLIAAIEDTKVVSPKRLVSRLDLPRKRLDEFCTINNIQRLSIFGSVLRNDYNSKSDVDVLVEFKQGKSPGFLKLAKLEEELSILFGGKKIDLRTPNDLSRYFRDRVLREAQLICQ